MAYRFTDTVKWNDTWFCELKPLSKLLFLYLCDQCDIAGFLELNVKKISFDLGTGKQEVERSVKEVSNKLIYSKDKRFIFIKKFLQHQRNLPLKETNKAHIAIINLLNQNLQLFDFTSINQYFEGGSKGDRPPLGNGDSIGNGDSKGNRFIKPTIEEIASYCKERNNGINANNFFDFYESKGWMVGKNKVKDWKACVRTWESRNKQQQSESKTLGVGEWIDNGKRYYGDKSNPIEVPMDMPPRPSIRHYFNRSLNQWNV